MPQLLLLRHAKSAWGSPATDDHDRPLAPRGETASKRIGAELRRLGLEPDRVLCSTAQRARETLRIALDAAGFAPQISFDARAYNADTDEFVALAQEFIPLAHRLLIVGHNDAIQLAAARLSPRSESDLIVQLETKYPAGGLAVIEFGDDDWNDGTLGAGFLTHFIVPRELD